MKNNNKFSIFISLILLIVFVSCVDKDFDVPDINPIPYDPDKVLTIQDLRDIDDQNLPYKFDDDYSLFATVVMDDKSGNIYRAAFIQDETGGINLRLMSPGGLYQGDYIRINLKNTTVSKYQQLWQIDSVNVDKNIEKLATWACETTTWGDPKPVIEPKDVNIGAIKSDAFQSQLIRLNDVQFYGSELGKYFANPNDQFENVNRVLMDCEWNTIIIRTSGFANFADKLLPEGRGSMIAIASRYRDDYQLLIRNYNEIEFDNPRCDDDESNIITIQEIRDLYAGGETNIPPNKVVRATVISDRANGNVYFRNAIIMDGSGAGIAIGFTASNTINLGTEIRLNAGTLPIDRFNGLLQIESVPNGNAVEIGSGTLPEPIVANIGEILANFEDYESRLVKINNASITGGSTFPSQGSLSLSDGTGSINLFSYSGASFVGAAVPTGEISITGIVSIYHSPQFLIRSLDDISE